MRRFQNAERSTDADERLMVVSRKRGALREPVESSLLAAHVDRRPACLREGPDVNRGPSPQTASAC